MFVLSVPDDVFAPNYIWKGSYNYKGRKQPMTLSITSFNTTTGRVNVTLTSSNMELLLSGWFICQIKCLLNRYPLLSFLNMKRDQSRRAFRNQTGYGLNPRMIGTLQESVYKFNLHTEIWIFPFKQLEKKKKTIILKHTPFFK